MYDGALKLYPPAYTMIMQHKRAEGKMYEEKSNKAFTFPTSAVVSPWLFTVVLV